MVKVVLSRNVIVGIGRSESFLILRISPVSFCATIFIQADERYKQPQYDPYENDYKLNVL